MISKIIDLLTFSIDLFKYSYVIWVCNIEISGLHWKKNLHGKIEDVTHVITIVLSVDEFCSLAKVQGS